ncbi:MAG TPA: prenyltransferase/squalene oxidase repeat-containing protein [Planctomycetota bacterium]|nr:prenyltransferase/squalene oxidase repeat-containing protein [Planctomycetota bacterium]
MRLKRYPICALLAALVLSLSPALHAGPTAASGEVELTREGKASIQTALQYLASKQRADGSFSGDRGTQSGIVAACLLAWMAAGNLPGEGPYGKHVAKSLDYLLSSTQASGLIFRGKGEQHVMYHHGLAAIALAEAWGQTRDKRIHDKLKNAIELIVRTQNEKGGWRYMPKVGDDDLSATVMQLLALRAAKDAGMNVPKDVIDRAISYVKSCASDKDNDGLSGFAYQPHGGKKWSTTAAGVMSLLLCGHYKEYDMKGALEYLVKTREKKEDKEWFIYGHYYGAQAMYQAGALNDKFKQYWLKWYPDISTQIIKSQKTTGSERGEYDVDKNKYGLWNSAMCVLILGIPYRYLPIYQR